MRILQVSSRDQGGGAERVAWNLFRRFRERGHESWLVVGKQTLSDPHILPLQQAPDSWMRFWQAIGSRLISRKFRGAWRLGRLAEDTAEPRRAFDRLLGKEDFHYPATRHLLQLTPHRPDILHCHNLHGGFFDLRLLPVFSRQLPVILTLHDAWLLSGHCSHSFDCERWKTGCGECPDLTIYPPLQRDRTAANWQRKRDIYAQCSLYIITPSSWLMKKVKESVLMAATVETAVIPQGVDLACFHPTDVRQARESLDLPANAYILLFSAAGLGRNRFKDSDTLMDTMRRIAPRDKPVLFLALGGNGLDEKMNNGVEIRCIPFQTDQQVVAKYFQSADLYLHASTADTFPLAVIEALACGIPVIATSVGGIPEQILSLKSCGEHPAYAAEHATGILVPVAEAGEMARAISYLLPDQSLRHQLGRNGAQLARQKYDLESQVHAYLQVYEQVLRSRVDPALLIE